MVAVFVPAGLGVRESVMLPLLSTITSVEASLALLIIVRLADIGIDGLVIWTSWVSKTSEVWA